MLCFFSTVPMRVAEQWKKNNILSSTYLFLNLMLFCDFFCSFDDFKMIPTFTCDRRKMGTMKISAPPPVWRGPEADFYDRDHMGYAQKLTKKKRT